MHSQRRDCCFVWPVCRSSAETHGSRIRLDSLDSMCSSIYTPRGDGNISPVRVGVPYFGPVGCCRWSTLSLVLLLRLLLLAHLRTTTTTTLSCSSDVQTSAWRWQRPFFICSCLERGYRCCSRSTVRLDYGACGVRGASSPSTEKRYVYGLSSGNRAGAVCWVRPFFYPECRHIVEAVCHPPLTQRATVDQRFPIGAIVVCSAVGHHGTRWHGIVRTAVS